MSLCRWQFKDKTKQCPHACSKGSDFCRRHKFLMNKTGKDYNILDDKKRTVKPKGGAVVGGGSSASAHPEAIPRPKEKEDDDISVCTIQTLSDNVEAQSNRTDDNVHITREYIFSLMDEYMEKHYKRSKWLKGKEPAEKKKGGMDLNTILGIAGVSLMPMLTKMMKDGSMSQLFQGQKKQDTNIDASNKQTDIKPVERPTRQQAEEFKGEDNIKWEKC